jgi:hypothetical protein
MRFSTTPRARRALLLVSATTYALSFADPGERLDAQDLVRASGERSVRVTERTPPAAGAFAIRRDPFSGGPSDDDDVAVAGPLPAPSSGVAADPGGPSVPDIAAGPFPAPLATAADDVPAAYEVPLSVKATIAGERAVAYVAVGSDLQLVRVGDTVAGRRVAAIDLRGISLADGTRIDLVERYDATPAPQRAGNPHATDAVLRELARLRSLIEARHAAASPTGAEPATAPTPAPPAAEAEPTPGPLPTPDTRGLPVGVNPTPNPLAPTAFPYVYPYAPPAH